MNLNTLKEAEQLFLDRHPQGFEGPEMADLGKKHRMNQLIELTQTSFIKKNFRDESTIVGDMVKIVGRSSMVSVFEKPKFKEFAIALAPKDKNRLAKGLQEMLHGNQQQGFENVVDILKTGKMAKWTLLTICPLYFRPYDEIFVKPTTAKGIIAHFELESLQYKATPSWEFYAEFRRQILEMKANVDSRLSPNNAAFTGFLMMTLGTI